MIEVDMTEEELIEITKNYLGIRYHTNADGDFEAYANAWTMIVDIFKWIRKNL
jgi:hypothetical protein